MLRIHFTPDDLARTRIASGGDVMWEIVSSLQLLQNREGPVFFDNWRRHVRGRLGDWVHPLATLAPHSSYFPDFLTPDEGSPSLEYGLDRVLSTPRAQLGEELGLLAAQRRLPGWADRLISGDIETFSGIGRAFRTYHATVIEPAWPAIQAHVQADRGRRLRAFAEGGIEGLLTSFRPLMRWTSPVLETHYPVRRELILAGRGLRLVPAYFCWRAPVTLVNPILQPTLVYPIEHDLRIAPEGPHPLHTGARPLAKLLGGTRAAVLKAVENGCTTTELSRRTGTSLASASQHATVLREAGLISTQRYGGAVLHTLTPLGTALLNVGRPFGGG